MKDLEPHALAIVEDQTISFSNKLTEIIKLHQVCNGFTKMMMVRYSIT